jgi:2-haloacid dehalogenase
MLDIKAIVFDLYGTLFDVHSVATACEAVAPGRGMELSQLWRQKQLEYTWLRSMMGQYLSFEQATADALDYCVARLGLPADAGQRATLCDAYLALQPHAEVPAALQELNRRGIPLGILSNGSVRSIAAVVGNAGLAERFRHLLSVEPVQVFKPDPRVYALGEDAFGLGRQHILFVSSNAWDATGAGHFGYPTCWVNRNGANTFECMGSRPTLEVRGIDAILASDAWRLAA